LIDPGDDVPPTWAAQIALKASKCAPPMCVVVAAANVLRRPVMKTIYTEKLAIALMKQRRNGMA
jgi:hypothetical protein